MKKLTKKNIIKSLIYFGIGKVSGFINGFFGAGGGLLLVPMISLASKKDSKTAHATTLGSVLFMCLASSVIYFVKGEFELKFLVVCGIGSIIGSIVGTKLLKSLKNNIIDLIFSCLLVLSGVFMIIF